VPADRAGAATATQQTRAAKEPPMTARTAAPAALLAVAALTLAGCGGTASDSAAPAPAATTTAAAPTSAPAPTKSGVPGGAITSPPAAGAGNAGELPAGFPLPPGTKVGPVAVQSKALAATLTVPDGKQVYDFWRQRLPAAGYTISESQMVGGIGEITFSGRDCAAGSQLGISGQDVSFECARG
jgi:hypothetical protein